MSASLVGSEMCIRDRTIASQRARSGSPRFWACSFASKSRSRSLTNCAVSYTHLTLPTICSV
eukprot:6923242-Alexandrium_andersonii.AAC.1